MLSLFANKCNKFCTAEQCHRLILQGGSVCVGEKSTAGTPACAETRQTGSQGKIYIIYVVFVNPNLYYVLQMYY